MTSDIIQNLLVGIASEQHFSLDQVFEFSAADGASKAETMYVFRSNWNTSAIQVNKHVRIVFVLEDLTVSMVSFSNPAYSEMFETNLNNPNSSTVIKDYFDHYNMKTL